MSNWKPELLENTENPLHLGGLRDRVGLQCMKNASARPGRHAANRPGCSYFRKKGNDFHGILLQRKHGSSILNKLHSSASSETTQTHCGHSTSFCGFPIMSLTHIYQPFSQGVPASFCLHNLWTAPMGGWVSIIIFCGTLVLPDWKHFLPFPCSLWSLQNVVSHNGSLSGQPFIVSWPLQGVFKSRTVGSPSGCRLEYISRYQRDDDKWEWCQERLFK
jgi:hypothetical protein